MRQWITVLFAVVCTVPAWASPAQDATVEKLLTLTKVQKSADTAVADADKFIQSTIQPMIEKKALPAKQRQTAKACLENYQKMIHESLSWKAMEPEYIRIYRETFTEEELLNLITFYESPTGRMLIQKTPSLEHKIGEVTNQRMKILMERLQPTCIGSDEQ